MVIKEIISFLDVLKKHNLLNNKHIPMIYKCNSRENRLKLLAGIIDSDGYCNLSKKYFSISQSLKHSKLMDDIIYLCRSLGFACYKKEKKTGYIKDDIKHKFKSYTINISGKGLEEIPTTITRKQIIEKRKQIKDVLVSGINVEYVGLDNYYGFQTDKNQRFVLGNFIVTHNSHIATKMIKDVLVEGNTACVICPTNKALSEIRNKYDGDDIEFMTIAQFLCKIKRYNTKGELTFKIGKSKEYMTRIYDYLFIDEASMIEDEDYTCFEELIDVHQTKIVYIGDNCQLPPVNKKESIVFKVVDDVIELKRIIRANNDDIKKVNKTFRGIFKGKPIDIKEEWKNEDYSNVYFTESRQQFLKCIKKNMNGDGKILAYTNKKVEYYNKLSRELLYGKNIDKYMKGEKIVFNNHFISGTDKYYSNQEVTIHNVMIVRKQHSNGKNYKVYKLIINDTEIYRVHTDDEKDYIANFSQMYKDLKSSKLTTEKEWEKYYDAKLEFLPPIDYSYSLTVHCSQGSTYHSVFLDMNDISSVAYNHSDVDLERVLYTGISRASDRLFCYY